VLEERGRYDNHGGHPLSPAAAPRPTADAAVRWEEHIREEVWRQIRDRIAEPLDRITMDVESGMITLRGRVPDERTGRLIADIVRSVSGVATVRNELAAGPAPAHTAAAARK
jgi:osmotically-inducible protein OsmY